MNTEKIEKYYEMYANPYEEDEMLNTGIRIKQAIEAAGYSAAEVARYLGLVPKSFYKILNGEVECKVRYLYEIAQLTDVSTNYLLFGETRTEGFEDIIAICQDIAMKDMGRVKKVLKAFVD